MDEMMEAPAPSVTLSGAAELGFKNVDNSSTPDAESIKLIRKYQVNFGSSGTTDGGLVFGAGISIEDEHMGDTKQVNGSNVYVGGADGTWKLKLGGNDPGIEQAGGIGVADDYFFGGDNYEIGLEGSFGSTSYRITMADPEASGGSDGDWSMGVSHSLGDYNVGVGMDSESGIALALGAKISGIGVDLYYSQSEADMARLESLASHIDGDMGRFAVNRGAAEDGALFTAASDLLIDRDNLGGIEYKGLGLGVSVPAGEGVSISAAYSKSDAEVMAAEGWAHTAAIVTAADVEANADLTAAGQVDTNKVTVGGNTERSLIELGMTYDLGGGASLEASVEKKETTNTYTISEANTTTVLNDSGGIVNNRAAADTGKPVSIMDSSDITTFEVVLAFTF